MEALKLRRRSSTKRSNGSDPFDEIPRLAPGEQYHPQTDGGGGAPETLRGRLTVRDRRQQLRRKKRLMAVLEAGVLLLRPEGRDLPRYAIDLGQVTLFHNLQQRRFQLESVDKVYHLEFWPEQQFTLWKDRLTDHQHYRQDSIINVNKQSGATDGGADSIGTSTSNASTNAETAAAPSAIIDETEVIKAVIFETRRTNEEALRMLEDCKDTMTKMREIIATLTNLVKYLNNNTEVSTNQPKIDPSKVLSKARTSEVTAPNTKEQPKAPTDKPLKPKTVERSTSQMKLRGPTTTETTAKPTKDEHIDEEEESISEKQMAPKIPTKRDHPEKDKTTEKAAAPVEEQVKLPPGKSKSAPAVTATPTLAVALPQLRTELPAPMVAGPSMSQIFKKAMWSKAPSLPINVNFPLTVLQTIAEELLQSTLLDRAVREEESVRRMEILTIFIMSGYSTATHRTRKPMNPLLGETYECDRMTTLGWRYHSEQVSHHPPISAMHADGNGWQWYMTFGHKLNKDLLRGTLEVVPEFMSGARLTLSCGDAEEYQWNKASSTICNLSGVESARFVSFHGDVKIQSSNGLICQVKFLGKKGDRTYQWVGRVLRGNQELSRLEGDLRSGTQRKGEKLCAAPSPPPHGRMYYGMSRFAIGLNDQQATDCLPPTDCRFRPDLRLLERGEVDKADAMKTDLETKQRDRRTAVDSGRNPPYIPLWFTEHTQQMTLGGVRTTFWLTNNRYWQSKQNHYNNCSFLPLWP